MYVHRLIKGKLLIESNQENPYLLSRTLYGIMQNLKDLNKRWSPNGWSNVVVCIVADGRKEINQQCLDVLTTIGIFQEGLMKLQVEDRPTQAHLFEVSFFLLVLISVGLVRYSACGR